MLGGLVMGLLYPRYSDALIPFLELSLMLILFLVFLKIDLVRVIGNITDLRLMLYLSGMTMLVIPLLMFLFFNPWDQTLALAMLLLTSMPAGMATPALADILKGNVELSMSLTIFTSLLAPVTAPLLFYLLLGEGLELSPWDLVEKLSLLVFLPMVVSIMVKQWFLPFVHRTQPYYSAANVIIFFFFVYATIGFQRDPLLQEPVKLLWQIGIIYLVYGFLHFSGYLMAWGRRSRDRVSIILANTYQNNGMAIVLAATLFDPTILLLMILSEFPWNTMPALYGKFLQLRAARAVKEIA